jgi:hypothetical protein
MKELSKRKQKRAKKKAAEKAAKAERQKAKKERKAAKRPVKESYKVARRADYVVSINGPEALRALAEKAGALKAFKNRPQKA